MADDKKTAAKIYFPNLNGLRAIGAFVVLIGHVEFLKTFWKLNVFEWFPIPGKVGVTLFFALSGFLLTSLLIQELNNDNTVHLKKFYRRRILRIWPLYYILIILSLFIFNKIGFLKMPVYSDQLYHEITPVNLLVVFLILPNFHNFSIPYADQRWSVVIEEQFYLVQPFLIKLFRTRKALFVVFSLIVFLPEIMKGVIHIPGLNGKLSPGAIASILSQLKYLGCIAIGCLSSLLFFQIESSFKTFLFRTSTQILTTLAIILCLIAGFYIFHTYEIIDYRIYSVLFSIVVINASQNPATIFNLENPVFIFLGKISYGLYMYHPICIGASIAIATAVTGNIYYQNIIIYTGTILLTVLIAWLSFTYIESAFLKLKGKTLAAQDKLIKPTI
jgi:peptidoglycan/LPS O-acetylase OafA/YrhL